MLELLERVPEFYEDSLDFSLKLKKFKVENILFCGMGGSGLVGDLVKDYLYNEIKVPIIVNKNDDIPEFVNNKTLVFVISYSGKSKETMKCFKKCKNKRAKVILITSKNIKFRNKIVLPKDFPSRVVLYFSLFPVLNILSSLGLIKDKIEEMIKAIDSLKAFKDVKKCEKIAKTLYKRIPVVYSYFSFRSVGYYWKTQLNELSKVSVVQNFFPEVNHNEIEVKDFQGFEVINLKENSRNLSSILYYLYSADYVAYFLAKMNRIKDPLKTPVIDRIKKKNL